jgi:hypothetical protein
MSFQPYTHNNFIENDVKKLISYSLPLPQAGYKLNAK